MTKAVAARQLVKKAKGLAEQGQNNESLACYLKAIEMNPKDEPIVAWADEAFRLAQRCKNIDLAITICETISRFSPYFRYDEEAALLAYKRDFTERGNAIVERLIRERDYKTAAGICKKIGNYETAVEYYEKGENYEEAIKLAKSKGLDRLLEGLYRKLIRRYEEWGEREIKESDRYYGEDVTYHFNSGIANIEKAAKLAEKADLIKEAIKIYENHIPSARATIKRLREKL